MLLRVLPLLTALLLLSSPSQAIAALVSATPASLPPATSENACTAFSNDGSESRIGLLCHNDPINKSDPTGLQVFVEVPPILFETEIPRPLLSDQIAEQIVPKEAVRIPPRAVEEAIRLNKDKNTVRLPDGRRVDLRGRSDKGHFDKATGERVRFPEVHDPKPEHPPGYQQYPRGNETASRNARPDDIRDVIRHLIDGLINK